MVDGRGPKHFIELRGIGIVDIKAMFGASSVRETQSIDLVIRLEDWDKEKEYDRLGLEESYTEYLGNKIVCHNIPIRPGRNLAIICETAAVNHRQKKMGYNAAQELYTRVRRHFIPDAGGDIRQDMTPLLPLVCGDLPFFQYPSFSVKQSQLDRSASYIHSDGVFFHPGPPYFNIRVLFYFMHE